MELNETQHYFTSNSNSNSNSNTNTNTNTVTATPSLTNGLLLPNNEGGGGSHHQMVYLHSVPSAVTTSLEPARRKRGRPRKYGTLEQAMGAKKTASLSSKVRREQQQQLGIVGGGSSKMSQLGALGNVGQGFTPHVINVLAGEDVSQRIMMFLQQSMHEVCILSASGTISNVSLRQPAISGGNIAYEGRFEIISLSGSYIRNEIGERTGGLSVCVSSTDGQVIGGGVGGPLKAAGPVQVTIGTFTIDKKKDVIAGVKGDASGSKFPSPVGGTSTSNVGFRSAFETSGRDPIAGNDDHQSYGGSHFMMQPRGMHMAPRSTDWRISLDDRTGFELTGKTGHGAHQSPENENYNHIAE